MPKKVYWLSPLEDDCQICQRPFNGVMFDCKIGYTACWGNICKRCFDEKRCQLGTGLGQEYRKQKDGRWLKVGG